VSVYENEVDAVLNLQVSSCVVAEPLINTSFCPDNTILARFRAV
jgi:hypothetical protein